MKTYKFKINGNDYNVEIKAVENQEMSIEVNGVHYNVTMETELEKKPVIARPVAKPQVAAAATGSVQRTAAPAKAANGNRVVAPLPGTILDVMVSVGDTVKAGQTVAILEAMKMENSIEADCDGTIKEVGVRKGDSVLEGGMIVVIG